MSQLKPTRSVKHQGKQTGASKFAFSSDSSLCSQYLMWDSTSSMPLMKARGRERQVWLSAQCTQQLKLAEVLLQKNWQRCSGHTAEDVLQCS
jgi:hypothetical protein